MKNDEDCGREAGAARPEQTSPIFMQGGESLAEAMAWLSFCLGETQAALEAVKGAALANMSRGEPVFPEQFAAMCEAAAGIITLRGTVSRGFRSSCYPAPDSRRADET